MEGGKIINKMEKEHLLKLKMGINMQATGLTTWKTELEKKVGQAAITTKESGNKEKNLVKVLLLVLMEIHIQVNTKMIN